MMKEALFTCKLKYILNVGVSVSHRFVKRTLLSKAYQCEEAWAKRLESPLLKEIELDQFFIETDKKFNTKNLVSGVDIDLFANKVENPNQLDELEHLLYRFRRTKRAQEMLDSTSSAVVRIYLKYKDYESLFRILNNVESYGVFPDLFSYNILMDTFIEEKLYREAAQIAILMMLQEDFSNEISSFLAIYSCHMFLKNNSLESLYLKPETVKEEKKENEEEEEEVLVRVPFFRNPWFDDHFDLTEPRHLIGKTFFLAGLEVKDDLLSQTFQLVGLGMYEKWEKSLELLKSLSESKGQVLLSEGIEVFGKYMDTIPNEDMKMQFEDLFKKMQDSGQIKTENLQNVIDSNISKFPICEKRDMELQKELFQTWEQERQLALQKENLILDKQRRLEEIARKKEYLYWREKELFFFENEERTLEELRKAEEIAALAKAEKKDVDTYVVPEMPKKAPIVLTKYQKLAKIKKI